MLQNRGAMKRDLQTRDGGAVCYGDVEGQMACRTFLVLIRNVNRLKPSKMEMTAKKLDINDTEIIATHNSEVRLLTVGMPGRQWLNISRFQSFKTNQPLWKYRTPCRYSLDNREYYRPWP